MDVKLDSLIAKLKQEGVEGAQKAADEILAKAKADAEALIEKARKAAEAREKDAEAKAAQFQHNAELAVKQAGRDAELLLKEQIQALFDRVFKHEVAKTMDEGLLKDAILSIIKDWGKGESAEVTVTEAQAKALESVLFAGVKKEVKDGVTLKPSSDLSGGFRIGVKGSDVYYDFSDASVAELLRHFLNARINAILAG